MSLVNQFNSLQNSYSYLFTPIRAGSSVSGSGTIAINGYIGVSNEFFTFTSQSKLTCAKDGYYEICVFGYFSFTLSVNQVVSATSEFGVFQNSTHIIGPKKIWNISPSFVGTIQSKTSAIKSLYLPVTSVLNTNNVYADNIEVLAKYRGKFVAGDELNLQWVRSGGAFDLIATIDSLMTITKYA